jgi:acyl carrier protein
LSLETELKNLIVEELKLQDVTPQDIADDMVLFGEGLGLDSLDAVELVVALKKKYNVDLQDMEEARQAFTDINSLAAYIKAHT